MRRVRSWALGSAVLTLLGVGLVVAQPAAAAPTVTDTATAGGQYVPVGPTRVLDTRNGTGVRHPGPVAARGTVTWSVASAGVPADAAAVILTVTATGGSGSGYLVTYPAGATRPLASDLDFPPRSSVANLAVVPLGTHDEVTAYASSSVNLIADVSGYIRGGAATGAGSLVAQSSTRVLDTRSHIGTSRTTPLPGGSALTVASGAPAGATAAVINLTALGSKSGGFLTAYAAGSPRPLVSSLNPEPGSVVSNLAVVPLSKAGTFTVFSTATTHLLADVDGYVLSGSSPPTAAGDVIPVTPTRLFDTRDGSGEVATGPVAAGGTLTLPAAGRDGIAETASAVVLNLTTVAPSAGGYVTAWSGAGTRPTTSSLNLIAHRTVAALVVVPLSPDGTFTLTVEGGATQLLADVAGYVVGYRPSAVTSLTASTISTTGLTLGWTPPTDGDDADTIIRRAPGDAAPATITDGDPVGTVDPPGTTISDSGLSPGTTYSYAVFAQDAAGDTAPAAVLTTTTLADTGPVTGLTASATATSVTLDWTDPVAGDYAKAVIRRAVGTSPPATATAGTAIAIVTAPSATSTDSGLLPDTQYAYAVFAQDTAGDDAVAATVIQQTPPLPVGPTGSIAGTVTTRAGALSGATVSAQPTSTVALSAEKSTTTAADGSYTLSGLVPGSYSVCFEPPGSDDTDLGQCWKDLAPGGSPTPVDVEANTTTGNIDAALETTGGTVTGQVTGSDGNELAGVDVGLDSPGIDTTYLAVTGPDGRYAISGLPDGDTHLCFTPDASLQATSATGYLPVCYPTASTAQSSTSIPVASDQVTSGVNVVLTAGAAVVGHVADAHGPVAGATIENTASYERPFPTAVVTGSDGSYALHGVTYGGFRICVDPPTGSSDVTNCPGNSGGGVGAVRNGDTVAVNIRLYPPPAETPSPPLPSSPTTIPTGSLSGTVRDARGVPLAGAEVYVSTSDGGVDIGRSPATQTAADGSYTASGLAPGDYTVEFDKSGYESQSWPLRGFAQQPEPIDVTGGSTATGIDGALTPTPVASQTLAGTVSDTAGTPLGNVSVAVAGGDISLSTVTASDGTYSAHVPVGTYQVCFSGGAHIQGPSSQGYVSACATSIAVTGDPSEVTANETLIPASSISGTVEDTVGRPVGGVFVEAESTGTPTHASYGSTAADGSYDLTGVVPGTYTLCFQRFAGTTSCYLEQANVATATPVAATSGTTTADIDEVVPSLDSITGTVNDPEGRPLDGIGVVATDIATGAQVAPVTTAADGTYTLGPVPDGSYDVCFTTSPEAVATSSGGPSSTGYLDQCYSDATSSATAAPVVVVPGETTAGIDASLSPAGALVGTVTDAAGQPLAGVAVSVTPTGSPDPVTGGRTDAAGRYRIVGLLSASYAVCFQPVATDSSIPVAQLPACSGGQPTTSPTAVEIVAGSTTTADGVLPTGGSVTGIVTDAAGNPLANVEVSLDTGPDPTGLPSELTDATGSFDIGGLSAYTYDVCFHANPDTGSSTAGYLPACRTVPVSVGTASDASASLPTAAGVVGTVTDAAGDPVADVTVGVGSLTPGVVEAGDVTTAADGSFVLGGLGSGSSTICFDVTDATQVGPDGVLSACAATGPLVAGAPLQLHEVLPYAGGVSGYVLTRHGLPGYGGSVSVASAMADAPTHAAAAGAFTVTDLPPGPTTLCVFDDYLTPVCTVTPVTIVAGQTVSVDPADPGPARVSGTVTDAGGPVAGELVTLLYGTTPEAATETTSDGRYALDQPANSAGWNVCFSASSATASAPQGDLPQCYATDGGGQSASITLTEGTDTTGIDAQLTTAGAIGGTVTDAAGTPLAGVGADAYASDGTLIGVAATGSDGSYLIRNLPAATYAVCFDAAGTPGSANACYAAGGTTMLDGTYTSTVTVSDGATSSGVNATLPNR